MSRATVMAGVAAIVLVGAGALDAQDLGRIGLPLMVDVRSPPVPVRADGKVRLVYELHLT